MPSERSAIGRPRERRQQITVSTRLRSADRPAICSAARGTGSDNAVAPRPEGQCRHRRLGRIPLERRLVDVVPRDPLVQSANIGVGLEIARKRRAQSYHRADLVRPAMRKLAREDAAQAPADDQHLAAVADRIHAAAQQLHRVAPSTAVEAEQPRVDPPPAPRQRAPQVHRRAVGGEEAGDDHQRRAVGRAAFSQAAERAVGAGEQRAGLGEPAPAGRSLLVRPRDTRRPSIPAAPRAAVRGRPPPDGSRAAGRGCAGSPTRCC